MCDDQSYVGDHDHHYEGEDRARAAHREKIVLACSKLFWLENFFGRSANLFGRLKNNSFFKSQKNSKSM